MAFFIRAAYSAPMRRARQGTGRKWPTCWLFTDERLGGLNPEDPLWRAVRRLPRGAGIVFRHYGWPPEDRQRLLAQLARVARKRHLWLIGSRISGAPDGVHRPRVKGTERKRGLTTASAHGRRELVDAFRKGADIVFLSPIFPTASHPGAAALGPIRFGLMARGAAGPIMALGGMTVQRDRRLRLLGASGFAAIDFWGQQTARQPGISRARC
jgi:thiamine-phosphate pyrophosphorylase